MRLKKLGQEEMVGFALIIIVVAVILLVFLGFSLKKPQKENVESYEVSSFISSFLAYTTDCKDSSNLEYLSIEKMIFYCNNNEACLDGQDSCDVLSSTLQKITEESWKAGEDRPVKRYELKITSKDKEIVPFIENGEITENFKASSTTFFRGGASFNVFFKAYY